MIMSVVPGIEDNNSSSSINILNMSSRNVQHDVAQDRNRTINMTTPTTGPSSLSHNIESDAAHVQHQNRVITKRQSIGSDDPHPLNITTPDNAKIQSSDPDVNLNINETQGRLKTRLENLFKSKSNPTQNKPTSVPYEPPSTFRFTKRDPDADLDDSYGDDNVYVYPVVSSPSTPIVPKINTNNNPDPVMMSSEEQHPVDDAQEAIQILSSDGNQTKSPNDEPKFSLNMSDDKSIVTSQTTEALTSSSSVKPDGDRDDQIITHGIQKLKDAHADYDMCPDHLASKTIASASEVLLSSVSGSASGTSVKANTTTSLSFAQLNKNNQDNNEYEDDNGPPADNNSNDDSSSSKGSNDGQKVTSSSSSSSSATASPKLRLSLEDEDIPSLPSDGILTPEDDASVNINPSVDDRKSSSSSYDLYSFSSSTILNSKNMMITMSILMAVYFGTSTFLEMISLIVHFSSFLFGFFFALSLILAALGVAAYFSYYHYIEWENIEYVVPNDYQMNGSSRSSSPLDKGISHSPSLVTPADLAVNYRTDSIKSYTGWVLIRSTDSDILLGNKPKSHTASHLNPSTATISSGIIASGSIAGSTGSLSTIGTDAAGSSSSYSNATTNAPISISGIKKRVVHLRVDPPSLLRLAFHKKTTSAGDLKKSTPSTSKPESVKVIDLNKFPERSLKIFKRGPKIEPVLPSPPKLKHLWTKRLPLIITLRHSTQSTSNGNGRKGGSDDAASTLSKLVIWV